jgi:hypothetical protein
VTEPVQGSASEAELAEQRRRARRGAFLLGALALAMYLGFILATGLRN